MSKSKVKAVPSGRCISADFGLKTPMPYTRVDVTARKPCFFDKAKFFRSKHQWRVSIRTHPSLDDGQPATETLIQNQKYTTGRLGRLHQQIMIFFNAMQCSERKSAD